MKHVITTILGNFDVHMSYSPAADDLTLNRLTATINKFATQPLVIVADEYPELDTIKDSDKIAELALELVDEADEAELEKALFESNRVGGGAAQMVKLSLKKREIDFPKW